MKHRISRLTVVAFLSSALVLSTVQAESHWTEDYKAAQKLAQTQKKDLLINISGSDWCVWCQRLDKEVFEQEAFLKQIKKDYVLVKLDYPMNTPQDAKIKEQNEGLRKGFEAKFGQLFYPTVFLADAKGTPYAKTGYEEGGAESYLKHLAELKQIRPLEDPGATWLHNYDVAKAKAQALDKHILVSFSGTDWCIWCVRLDKEVFDQDLFKQEAPKDFVLVKFDFLQRTPQDPKIKQHNQAMEREFAKYGFRGQFPTVFLADSQGIPYAQTSYQPGGPAPFVEMLKETKKNKPK